MTESSTCDGPLTLADCLRLVTQFHCQIKAPECAGPSRLLPSDPAQASFYSKRFFDLSKEMADYASGSNDQLLGRAALAVEELSEWLATHAANDLIGAADAIADRLYVLLGDAVATGMPLDLLFEEVHRSNMTKLPFIQTGHGRGAKGPTYRRPDINRVLREYERTTIRG